MNIIAELTVEEKQKLKKKAKNKRRARARWIKQQHEDKRQSENDNKPTNN